MDSLQTFLKANRFIVLGGHKCGTTSLHAYLEQHPEIIMPRVKGQDILNSPQLVLEDYQNSYRQVDKERIFGEVSSSYLYSHIAASYIKKYFPDAKLLVILRHPVDRAFSNFNRVKDQRNFNFTFKDVCNNYQEFADYKFLKYGLYFNYIKNYLDTFEPQQVKVLLFDSLVKNNQKFFLDFFEFIGVDQTFLPDTSFIVRKGGQEIQKDLRQKISSNPFLQVTVKPIIKKFTNQKQRYAWNKKINNVFVKKEHLSDDLKASLMDYYSEDILKTQELLNIDLSHWLSINKR